MKHFKHLVSGAVMVGIAVPFLICRGAELACGPVAEACERLRWKVHRWAYPEKYAPRPRRAAPGLSPEWQSRLEDKGGSR